MDDLMLSDGFRLFSREEREAIISALDGPTTVRRLIQDLTKARRRSYLRYLSNSQTDASRRLLVGARVPRETAERYRECARSNGMSLYRFTCSALEREYRRLTE